MVNQVVTSKLLVSAVVAALIWAVTHYFVRLGMNPEVTDLEAKRTDTFYGALAVVASTILKALVEARL